MASSEKRAWCLACVDWHPVSEFQTVKLAGFESAVCIAAHMSRAEQAEIDAARRRCVISRERPASEWGPFPKPDWAKIDRDVRRVQAQHRRMYPKAKGKPN